MSTTEEINLKLSRCRRYVVQYSNGKFRLPSRRLCPVCNYMVELRGNREHCKHIDECFNCGTPFCMSCLRTKRKKADLWPKECGGGYDICEEAPLQQL